MTSEPRMATTPVPTETADQPRTGDDIAVGIQARAEEPVVVINRIELPTRTIFKVLLTLAILWFVWQINGFILQFFVALILAAAMTPPIRWLQGRGVPRVPAVVAVVLTVLALLGGVIYIFGQPLVEQVRAFIDDAPGYVDRIEAYFQTNTDIDTDISDQIEDTAGSGSADPSTIFDGVLSAGTSVVSGISSAFVVLILAVYILLEGERTLRWLTRELPVSQQRRLWRLVPEMIRVVGGYITGQLINSTLFGAYAFIVLSVMDVPQALLLGLLAAFADAIPIVGVPLATIPATIVALTVSWQVALIVFVAYIIYQQIENYVIVPRVFQGTLHVSSFAVLIGVLIGTSLLGILGAILALPITAAIPVIQRVLGDEELPEAVARITSGVTEGSQIGRAAEEQAIDAAK